MSEINKKNMSERDLVDHKIKVLLADLKYKENEGKPLSSWEQFQKERAEIDNIPENEKIKIEQSIKLQILEIFKKGKGGFFSYDPFLEMKGMEHFPIISTSGDRNIGKTYSAKDICRKTFDRGKRWIWLRNIEEEVKAFTESEGLYFQSNGWEYNNSAKAPNIETSYEGKNGEKYLVGWIRAINTIGKFKSIEFPDAEVIVWDEFSSRVQVQGDKFGKFSEFITTAQRHRPNLKIILQANYVDQHDPIMTTLGTPIEAMDDETFVNFDWISGTISIYIPKGIYKSTGEEDKKQYLGYRTALKHFATYKSQYGGGFKNDALGNLLNYDKIFDVEPKFNIFHTFSHGDTSKMTLYSVIDKDGFEYDVLTETLGNNDKPIFTFDGITDMKYNNSYLLEPLMLETLVYNWKKGVLKTTDMDTYNFVIKLFATAKKIIEKDNEKIIEVENIFV